MHLPERLYKASETVLCSKGKTFWKDRIMKLGEKSQKVVEQNMRMLSNKVLVKMKKYVYFYFKIEGSLQPIQKLCKSEIRETR